MEGFEIEVMEDIILIVKKKTINPLELEAINNLVRSATKFTTPAVVIPKLNRPVRKPRGRYSPQSFSVEEKYAIMQKYNFDYKKIMEEYKLEKKRMYNWIFYLNKHGYNVPAWSQQGNYIGVESNKDE